MTQHGKTMNKTSEKELLDGIYLLRCGYADFAFRQLREVDLKNLSPEDRFRWALESFRALRLGWRLKDAQSFLTQIEPILASLSEEQIAKWKWELLNFELQATGKADSILANASSQPFNDGSYALEAKLVGMISDSSQLDWTNRLPSIDSLYSKVGELSSVHLELLVLAANAKRCDFSLGSVFEYQFLSLKLSAGRTHDVLNLFPHIPKCPELYEETDFPNAA